MKLLLNIGLARKGNSNIGVGTVLRELAATGCDRTAYAVHHSDTEITVVAEAHFTGSLYRSAIHHLAQRLGQDCIAVLGPLGHGQLIGPRAAAWGAFNPEFFLLLDGSRLASPALPVAA